MLDGKNLKYRPLWEFEYRLLVNKDSPLAKENPDGIVKYSDLEDYIEIVHGDLSVPSLSFSKVSRSSVSEHRKSVYMFTKEEVSLTCSETCTTLICGFRPFLKAVLNSTQWYS